MKNKKLQSDIIARQGPVVELSSRSGTTTGMA